MVLIKKGNPKGTTSLLYVSTQFLKENENGLENPFKKPH